MTLKYNISVQMSLGDVNPELVLKETKYTLEYNLN
jgi:hypothetical protein